MTREDTTHGRFYVIDGVRYPSVTTILAAINKPALVPWAANREREKVSAAAADLYATWAAQTVRPQLPRAAFLSTLHAALGPVRAHEKILEDAGNIGSQVHKYIEWAIRMRLGAVAGPEPVITAEAMHGFRVFDSWAASVRLKPVLVERTVHSTVHGYAGTMDLLARVHGKLVLLDFKTGKAVYPEAFLQNAAYRMAAHEMGYPPVGGLVVRLPKVVTDPAMEVVPVPSVVDLFPVFLATQALWHWTQQHRASRVRKPGPRRVVKVGRVA
jgi:hypothetical protein